LSRPRQKMFFANRGYLGVWGALVAVLMVN
jgi:hypothetical protein